ncbi:ABC transporter permease [Spongiivirga citrea]|uniref:FtsX-like permease family protein n=1 Tax=Spongiivirga citrea TaxID=1481457 RepID=A0A6M0CMR7_9FLAO|nr:ABC transporter permease [Spongiivirga citrea]NER18243.1 FtsX-like permease family protein [Spongiivirga citrea]
MFDIDRWQELFDAIRKNKLRTFLTGLSVASGIFILVILLGFGQGFQNGIRHEFEADATSRVWVWTNPTSKEFKGLNPGRSIWLKNENIDYANDALDEYLETSSGVSRVRATITYKGESGSYGIQGISPDYQEIENVSMTMGRFINQADMASNAKVVVISNKVYREMMDKEEDPLGEYLELSRFNFKIIGVFIDNGGEREENRVYIPRTTAQTVFNGQNRVNNIAFTLKEDADFDAAVARSKEFVKDYETYLKQVNTIAPNDESAIRVFSALEEAKRYYSLASNIALFFWFVGICTIIAGVVGVSNIMLIVVKERTREIGIRKALGAKPWAVVGMILHESIFVTALAGFTGLIFSMGLFELVGPSIEVDYIVNPSVDFNTALTMVFVLIFAGALAGFFPAWRAARIQPIVALRDE